MENKVLPMLAPPSEYIPQLVSDRRPLVLWSIVAVGSIAVVAMIVGAPLAQTSGHNSLALAIYGAFSHFCHQIPERSFFVAGHQFAVCARCTGLYAGIMVATVCYPLIRSLGRTDTPQRRGLFVAAAPLAIDFGLTFFGLWENTHLSRFSTGALLGGASVFYLIPGLMAIGLRGPRRKPGADAELAVLSRGSHLD